MLVWLTHGDHLWAIRLNKMDLKSLVDPWNLPLASLLNPTQSPCPPQSELAWTYIHPIPNAPFFFFFFFLMEQVQRNKKIVSKGWKFTLLWQNEFGPKGEKYLKLAFLFYQTKFGLLENNKRDGWRTMVNWKQQATKWSLPKTTSLTPKELHLAAFQFTTVTATPTTK
jgi:hypothetical protein